MIHQVSVRDRIEFGPRTMGSQRKEARREIKEKERVIRAGVRPFQLARVGKAKVKRCYWKKVCIG
jgi:hypothetical protein